MEFKGGNKAIKYHRQNDKKIFLFQETKKTFIALKAELKTSFVILLSDIRPVVNCIRRAYTYPFQLPTTFDQVLTYHPLYTQCYPCERSA